MSLTDAQYQANACALVGDAPRNAIFELWLPIATEGGTFVLDYEGETTTDLAYNVSAAAMQSALEALPTIGVGGALVEGLKKGPYQIELVGALGGQPAGTMTGDGSELDPPAVLTPTLLQDGKPSRIGADAVTVWAKFASISDLDLRYLYTARDLCLLQMGKYVHAVDQRDGQEESKDSGIGVNLRAILSDLNRQIGEQQAIEVQTSSGTVFPLPIKRGVVVRDNYAVRRNVVGRV